jgi:hypothetical protein
MAIAGSTEGPLRAVMLCGTGAPDQPSRRLKAGALETDLENGQLRYLSFAGVEVLRGVSFLVRDENWGTYTAKIDNLIIEETSEGFSVRYRAVCADARQRLAYEAHISGSADGSLLFSASAVPETDVITNRTGFVVLHPAGLAGQMVRVTHVDGEEVETRFPDRISPSQPIFNIRALTHEIAPGLWATCRMEGDAFEMEDQRNWSDASYKTYVRPLALPWGYKLEKGSRHEQSVRLSIRGAPPRRTKVGETEPSIGLGADIDARVPSIGVALPISEIGAALDSQETLRLLRPHFFVCTIDGRDAIDRAQLEAYREAAEAASARIVMEAIVPDDVDVRDSLAPIAKAVRESRLKIDSLIVSSAADLKSWQPAAERPEKPTIDEICAAARAAFPGVRLGGGMLATFTELNRKRPRADLVDYVTHTTCSIVHSADDRSVMETLETLPAIIASTKAMSGGKPYRIGPSAIGARDNPYGKRVTANPANERVCLTNRDPRQRGLFNAAWMLGYIAACAREGLEAVALGAVTGPFGVIRRGDGDAEPYFDSAPDAVVYPAFHVMAGLIRGFGRQVVDTRISAPRRIAALAWREEDKTVLWVSNLTAEPLSLRLENMAPAPRRIAYLDASTFEVAVRETRALDELARPFPHGLIALDAYAVARVD